MTFFEKIFNFKFKWVTSLFNSMQKAWNHLGEEEKKFSVQASGITAIINANIDKTPDVVFQLIQAKFPEITKEHLHDLLTKGLHFLKVGDDAAAMSLEDAIKWAQSHLGSATGNNWMALSQSFASTLLTFLLPSTSPLNKITILMEWVYTHLVKGKIA